MEGSTVCPAGKILLFFFFPELPLLTLQGHTCEGFRQVLIQKLMFLALEGCIFGQAVGVWLKSTPCFGELGESCGSELTSKTNGVCWEWNFLSPCVTRCCRRCLGCSSLPGMILEASWILGPEIFH